MSSYHRLGMDHASGWSHLGASRISSDRVGRSVSGSASSVDYGRLSNQVVDDMFGFEELEDLRLNLEIDDLLSSDDDASYGDGLADDDLYGDEFTDDEDEVFGDLKPYSEPTSRRESRSSRNTPDSRYGSMERPFQPTKPSCASCSGQDSFGSDIVVPIPFMPPPPPSRTDMFADSAVVGAGIGLGFFGALWMVSSLARGMSS